MANEAHIRADEGLKRPRYAHRPPMRRNEEGQVEAIPPTLDPDQVLEQYLNAQTTSHIAKALGIKRKSLVRWLREVRPDKWKQVQIIRALIRKEDADEGAEGARDALSLARARDMLRSAQFDLERLDHASYGQHIQQTIELTGDLGDRLRRARERVIEGQVVADTARCTAIEGQVIDVPIQDETK